MIELEEIVKAYKQTRSVWKAAKKLGLCGQSVHERLRAARVPLQYPDWTKEEIEEMKKLAESGVPIGKIAEQLNRTYAATALKLSRNSVPIARHWGHRKPKRSSGMTKARLSKLMLQIEASDIPLRQIARMNRFHLTPLVSALRFHFPKRYELYSQGRSDLAAIRCPGCDEMFTPLTKKQKACSSLCGNRAKRDREYFGGKRLNAIGMREKICQLCEKKFEKRLSAHHVLGKENDPENVFMVALCSGCHDVVTRIAGRTWADNPEKFQYLISLVELRRGHHRRGVIVEFEDYTEQEAQEMLEEQSA